MSGFEGTGVIEDEGQYLQTVFPITPRIIGPARMAFSAAAHQTEESPLAVRATGERLLQEWSPYWDLSRPILLEKSPPNALRMRFLQAIFPSTTFVVVLRHPLMASLATRKWTRGRPLHVLLKHWFALYELAFEDASRLRSVAVVKFEDFADDPRQVLSRLTTLLDVGPGTEVPRFDDRAGSVYRDMWTAYRSSGPRRRYADRVVRSFEERANRFGYSLVDLDRSEPLQLPR